MALKKLEPRSVGVGSFAASNRMRELINQVLDSGIISYGEKSKKFEREFATIHGCDYGILSNSGTSALQVALQAMRETYLWGSGNRVIVPATTFVASANVVIHNRMLPVFVDVSPDTFNIDENLIEDAITENRDDVRAIMAVHLFGQPCNMSAIMDIASRHGLRVIEDSCETMFAEHKGKRVGSWGDIGCFSTYVAHIIVTGVGGISTTNDKRLAAKMRSLVNHGLQLEYLNPDDNFSPRPTPGRRFKFDTIGHSFRITELEAAIGLAQLEVCAWNIAMRQRNARHLQAGIDLLNDEFGEVIIQTQKNIPENHDSHAHMMFPMVLNDPNDKEPLMAFLNERMVETRDMLPMLNQPAYSWMDQSRYPVSKRIVDCGLYVGCHQFLQPSDIDYVLQCLNEYYQRKLINSRIQTSTSVAR